MTQPTPTRGTPLARPAAASTDATGADPMAELMRAAQAGDSDAYRLLLEDAARRLRGHIRRRAPWLDAEDREDLVQEVLISMHGARASYDPARPFMPWLAAIARNRIADHARRHRRRAAGAQAYRTLAETFDSDAVNHSAAGVVAAMSLQRAMADLTPAQREAVQMLKIEQLSLAEASARSGLSIAALKVSVHRAVRRLRARLGGGA